MSEPTASFGDVLRRLRSEASLSQEELAERAGLSRRGISDLERGAHHAPQFATVRLLAVRSTSMPIAGRPCWPRPALRRWPR